MPIHNKGTGRLNGVLAVHLREGTTLFEAPAHAKSEDIALYLASIACEYAEWGYCKLLI